MANYYLLGCDSGQTRATLVRLLALGRPPAAVLQDLPLGTETRALPLTLRSGNDPHSLCGISAAAGLPCQPIVSGQLAKWLEHQPAAPLLVSCYPHRIPRSLLESLPLGGFNLHPSPLPAYRGPAPIFWQLRDGRQQLAITLHQISEQLDQGEILGQAELPFRAGDNMERLSRLAGTVGAELFIEHLDAIARGSAQGIPQNHLHASYQGWPTAQDLLIDPDWSALRVYTFVNGVRPDHFPLLEFDGQRIPVERAPAWGSGLPPQSPARIDPSCLIRPCPDGWVALQPKE